MAGRRSKYTPETVDKLTQAIRLGATYQLACNFAGIGVSTFHEWLNAKPEFAEVITQAEGDAAIKWLALVNKHATDQAQWAAWMLERRYPEMYGRQRMEITGADNGPIQTEIIIRQIPERKDD
jgi:transposase